MKQENRNKLIGKLRSCGMTISKYCMISGMARSTFTAKANSKESPDFTRHEIADFGRITGCSSEELYEIFIKED